MLKLSEELKEKISFGLIAGIILTAVVPLIITFDNSILLIARSIFVAALAGLYAHSSENKDLVFVALITFVVSSLVKLVIPQLDGIANSVVLALPWIVSTIVFGLLALKHSKEFKAFEMLEVLFALFLLVTVSKYFIATEYAMYYAFGVCFLVSTLMYNNNIWMRYFDTEKDLLILILVVSFVEVIQVSAKFISF